MTPEFPTPAWLVGCGNMAGAMVEGWRSAGMGFAGVTVIRPSGNPVKSVTTVTDYPAGERPRFVMLGFKPQKLNDVAPGLAPHVGAECTVVSMLAGVSSATLRELFPIAKSIIRVMPNLPVAQGQGVTAIYSADGSSEQFPDISRLMASLGMIIWCELEEELGVIGAIASAGIAYVARFTAALAESGEAMGMQSGTAEQVAIQTLIGAAAYAKDQSASMAEIARRVASPNGTTERGLAVLDADDGLQQLVNRTIEAAVRRSKELAADAARRN
jgi:pyrroline-5-carboxylate reductase